MFVRLILTVAVVATGRPESAAAWITADSADVRLATWAKEQPDSVRDAITKALSASVAGASENRNALHRAVILSRAYSVAWRDSFLERQVAMFSSWSRATRYEHVAADSLRRAGNKALGDEGVPAATRQWRESLRRARAIGDSPVTGQALLSMGAGFYRLGNLDSATIYVRRAEQTATRIGDVRTVGNAIGILASIQKDRGNTAAATELYQRASETRLLSGDTRGIAADQNNIGLIAQDRGDFDGAAKAFERALNLNRRDHRSALVALNLSNLAAIETYAGHYARAESLYVEALSLHAKSGDRAETAFVKHGLGKLYMSRGDYQRASDVLGDALKIHDASGATTDAAAVRVDLAAVKTASGHPEEARALLKEAERATKAAKAPPLDQARLALAHGDMALQFSNFADADTSFSQAARLYRSAGDSSGLAQALTGKAILLRWRGENESAQKILLNAARVQKSIGDVRSAALTTLINGEVQGDQGDFDMARRTLQGARETFHKLGDVVAEASALASIAELSLRTGSPDVARVRYRQALQLLGSRRASQLRWRIHTGLGTALRRNGRLAESAAELRVAIEDAESTKSGLRLEESRSGFMADKWTAYTELALVEQARGRFGDAFAVSERMRARQLLDLLSRGRTQGSNAVSGEEQDLRQQISMLTRRLEAWDSKEPRSREPIISGASLESTRRQLDQAQKKYAQLLSIQRDRDPAYVSTVSATTRTWRDVASRLRPDQVLLEYMLTDSASTMFVVTSDTVTAIDLGAGRQEIANLVEFAGRAIGASSRGKLDLWRTPLRRLYAILIGPAAAKGYLRGKRTLIIAPHSELHFLSFAALLAPGARDEFLVERFQVAYAPSATVWMRLGERRAGLQGRRVLAMAPNIGRLPGSRREVSAISRMYGSGSLVKLGADASPQALRSALPSVGTIHLATFGVLNKHNPLFSFVELAPSAGDDGRLEVNEVFGLGMTGQLVILSACQTALASGEFSDVPPGDDWLGLVQAFLQAGARSVVASLWPVDDNATSALMLQFHAQLSRGTSPVAALAQAQRVLLRDVRTSRPVYWAAFTVNGRTE